MKYRLALDVADPGLRSAPGRWGAGSCNSPTPAEHSHSGECLAQAQDAPMLQAGPFKHHNSLPKELLTSCNGCWPAPSRHGTLFVFWQAGHKLPLPLLLQISPQKLVLLANLKTFTVKSHKPLYAFEHYSLGPSLFSPAAVWLRVRRGRVLMQTYSSTQSFHKITVHILSSED